MTIWKSLLLSTASAFVAVGAQAADLPVKAKPVQYVKICSIYGEGFYYIPGSDTCVRFGGYVRADYYWHGQGNGGVPFYTGAQARFTRATDEYSTRHRASILMDTRSQTEYGVLRTVEQVHLQFEAGAFTFTVARAFIQWAGFTFGHSQSYTDIFTLDSYQFGTPQLGGSTDGDGINMAAYTVQFGSGFSLTGEMAERRKGGISGKSTTNLSNAAALVVGSTAVDNSEGQRFPDFSGILKYDDKAGNFGVFAAVHDASASYYGATTAGACGGVGPGAFGVPLIPCGHPGDKLGWAAGAGGTVKLPWIAPGDRAGAQFVYSVGAAGYAALKANSAGMFGNNSELAVGWVTDGVFVNGSNLELTTAWSVVAGYEHNWTPQFKTSVYAAYLQVEYSPIAKGFFAATVCPAAAGGQTGFNTVTNCNPDYAHLYAGVRSQWSPAKDFLLGVDVTYTHIDTAFGGGFAAVSGVAPRPTGVYRLADQDDVTFTFRAQRNF